ncbi:glycosyltransferase [Empedobacter sp.]|uniref:glycosyltransferase n=1 Tax=Empedobacter sp. TaxID=1927715 RepID=UPI0028A9C077|nr:glycosyltransferase [Empedobacter sp.]
MIPQKKYIFIQNILTPYRISFFNELEKKGFDFEVYYMREKEDDRDWIIDYKKIKYKYFLDNKGFYKMKGRYHFHFNPRLLFRVIKNRNSEFILGGSWNDLNVIFICILNRIKLVKTNSHFWSEANYLTIGAINDNKFKFYLRKFVFHSFKKGFVLCPGMMTKITFDKWKIKNENFVISPNTIDENLEQSNEIYLKNNSSLPVFFTPARIVENIKGLINFFENIGDLNCRKAIFKIAGDGPDKKKLRDYVISNNLENNIILLGFCNSDEVKNNYGESNAFFLPSFSDQSPLSLVEALAFGLPVLVSDRCGNHFEAVSKENGILFNPHDPKDIRIKFEDFLSKRNKWEEMGDVSKKIFINCFSQDKVVNNMINQIYDFEINNNIKIN